MQVNVTMVQQVATNAIDITIDETVYRVAKEGLAKYHVWTWTGENWDYNKTVPENHLNTIAREISAFDWQ